MGSRIEPPNRRTTLTDTSSAMLGTSNEGPNDEAALSEELKAIAYRELGETPEVRRESLEKLRELLADDPSLHSPTDDAFLTKFLRARKYNVDKAFKNIKKYFQARKNQRDMFEDLNPASTAFDVACRKHQLVTLSHGRDSNGIPVVMVKPGTWRTNICSLTDFIRVCAVHLEYLLLDEEVQIKGLVVVWDLKGFGLYHVTQYTPSVLRRLFSLVQEVFPMRLKALYVPNNPVIFEIFLAFAKPLVKSKLFQRVTSFRRPMEALTRASTTTIQREHCRAEQIIFARSVNMVTETK
ncbi:alpha-tocopherol transfer protein-like isoform X2 [Haemaphysalis longicornis]